MRMMMKQSAQRRGGFMLMEVILALLIFAIVAASFTKALNSLWRHSSYVKQELVITQILDSALHEALYLERLEEGSKETFVPERDVTLDTQVTPLILENQEGTTLQQMWEVRVIARYMQDNQEQEAMVRGWRYLPLYKP